MTQNLSGNGQIPPFIADAPFWIAGWEVKPERSLFCRDGLTKKVAPQVMAVFLCLARAQGQVVSSDSILSEVWQTRVAHEDTLARAISDLRGALGDEPGVPTIIETVGIGGYRLMVEIELNGKALLRNPKLSDPVEAGAVMRRGPVSWRWLVLFFLLGGLGWATWLRSRGPEFSALPPLVSSRPFTALPGHESFPSLSPDGKVVAFTWGVDAPEKRFDIYVKPLNLETPVQLTAHPGLESFPVWSPDGMSVAFVRATRNGSTAIYQLPIVGGKERKILETHSRVAGMDWSPDGQFLVISERPSRDEVTAIFKVSLADRRRQRLSFPPETILGDYQPTFSPDGGQIAFLRRNAIQLDSIMVVSAQGGAARRLVTNQAHVRGICWLPDQKHLIFSSYRDGRFGLWRVALAGGELTWVPGRGEHIFRPAISRSGRRLVYETGPFNISIWQMKPNGASKGATAALIQSRRLDSEAVFSPNGQRIAFVSARSGSLELWVSDHLGVDPRRLTHLKGPLVGRPFWSPDGEAIAFGTWEDGRASIYVIQINGGEVEVLYVSQHGLILANWSRDGHALLLGSDQGGSWQIWRMGLANKDLVQVTQNGGLIADEAFEGGRLYFSKPFEEGIWSKLDDGGETLIIGDLHPSYWRTWALHPQGIFYVRNSRNGVELCRYDVGTQRVRVVSPMDEFANSGLSVSPDGGTFLFSRRTHGQSDLMIAEEIPK